MRIAIIIALGLVLTLRLAAQSPRLIDLDRADDRVAEMVAQFEALVAAGNVDDAVLVAQRYLDDHREQQHRGLSEVWPLIAAPGETGLFIESSYLVARRLASASPALRERYAEMLADRAQADFAKRRILGPINALESQRRFPVTATGIAALEAAAHAALEAGRCQFAARLFGDLIDLDWSASANEKAARAAALLLSTSRTETLFLNDPGAAIKGPVRLGNRQLELHQLARELEGEAVASPVTETAAAVPQRFEAVWHHPLPGGEIGSSAALLPQPQAWEKALIFHDRGGVEALNQSDGSPLWERIFDADDPSSLGPEMDDPDLTALGSSLVDGRYFFVSASLDANRRAERRLIALSAATGATLWQFNPKDLAAELAELYLDPQPVAAEDRVFLTAWDRSTTPRCHLLILSATTGTLLSVSRLPPGVPLAFEDAEGNPTSQRHWFSALRPALVQGFVIVCDNLGQIAALDAESGEPRFLLQYRRRRSAAAAQSASGGLPRGFDQVPILSCGDRIVVAPDDSDELLAFFLRPAADAERRQKNLLLQRASATRRDGLQGVLAFDGQSVLAQGRDSAEDLDVIRRFQVFRSSSGGPQWSSPIDSGVLGQGFLDQKSVYLSTHKYVYGLDLSHGAVFGPMVSREADGAERLGNLIPVGNLIFVAARRGIQAFRPVW